MNKKELLKELEEKFKKLKEELQIESSLDEIDDIFFIRDYILREGFVSENLSRQICSRIADLYLAWNNYLHSLIMPNPQNILNMSEAKLFNNDEKKEISELMKKAMAISSRNSLIGLTKDTDEEAEFIDYAVEFWNETFKEKLIPIMAKINEEWEEKVK